jgi:hypothetical protein
MAYSTITLALQTDDVIGFTAAQRTAVELQGGVSISAEGSPVFKNLKYPRHKGFYGYAQLMSGAFVAREIPINFLNQQLIFWKDDLFAVSDLIICAAKLLGTGFTPQLQFGGSVIKTRQEFTSLRFRFHEGVQANLVLGWLTGESKCGNLIEEPENEQGKPLSPSNARPSPTPRPPDSNGDPADRSRNDGKYDPSSGDPQEPLPGGLYGFWYANFSGYREDGSAYSGEHKTPIDDPRAVMTAGRESLGVAYGGHTFYRWLIYANGAEVDRQGTGGDLQINSFSYHN